MLLQSRHETAQAIGEKQETLPVAVGWGAQPIAVPVTGSHRQKVVAKGLASGQSLQFQERPSWRHSICLPVEINCDATGIC